MNADYTLCFDCNTGPQVFVLTSASKREGHAARCPERAAREESKRAHGRSTAGTSAPEDKARRAAKQSNCRPQATPATGHNRQRIKSSRESRRRTATQPKAHSEMRSGPRRKRNISYGPAPLKLSLSQSQTKQRTTPEWDRAELHLVV